MTSSKTQTTPEQIIDALWKEKIAGSEMVICKVCGYFGLSNVFDNHKCWEPVSCPEKQ